MSYGSHGGPRLLGTEDVNRNLGYESGPSLVGSDPNRDHMAGFADFFGPPASQFLRDIDDQSPIEVETVERAFTGRNKVTESIIITILMTQDKFPTSHILPFTEHSDGLVLSWDVTEFTDHVLRETPVLMVPRLVSSKKYAGKASMIRQAIGVSLEWDFYKTSRGQMAWSMHILQIVNAISVTSCLGVLLACLTMAHIDMNMSLHNEIGTDRASAHAYLVQKRNDFGGLHKKGWLIRRNERSDAIMNRRCNGSRCDIIVLPGGTANLIPPELHGSRYIEDQDPPVGMAPIVKPPTPRTIWTSRAYPVGNDEDDIDPTQSVVTLGSFFVMEGNAARRIPHSRWTTAKGGARVFSEIPDAFVRVDYEDAVHYAGLFRTPKVGNDTLDDPANSWASDVKPGGLTTIGQKYFGSHLTWGSYMEAVGVLDAWIETIEERSSTLRSLAATLATSEATEKATVELKDEMSAEEKKEATTAFESWKAGMKVPKLLRSLVAVLGGEADEKAPSPEVDALFPKLPASVTFGAPLPVPGLEDIKKSKVLSPKETTGLLYMTCASLVMKDWELPSGVSEVPTPVLRSVKRAADTLVQIAECDVTTARLGVLWEAMQRFCRFNTGVNLDPAKWLQLVLDLERFHIETQIENEPRGASPITKSIAAFNSTGKPIYRGVTADQDAVVSEVYPRSSLVGAADWKLMEFKTSPVTITGDASVTMCLYAKLTDSKSKWQDKGDILNSITSPAAGYGDLERSLFDTGRKFMAKSAATAGRVSLRETTRSGSLALGDPSAFDTMMSSVDPKRRFTERYRDDLVAIYKKFSKSENKDGPQLDEDTMEAVMRAIYAAQYALDAKSLGVRTEEALMGCLLDWVYQDKDNLASYLRLAFESKSETYRRDMLPLGAQLLSSVVKMYRKRDPGADTSELYGGAIPKKGESVTVLIKDLREKFARAPITWSLVDWGMKNNMPYLFNLICFRFHVREVGSGFGICGRGEAGYTFKARQNFFVALNAAQQLINGHFSIWSKPVVLDPRKIDHMWHCSIGRYIGGNETRFWDPTSKTDMAAYEAGQTDKDIIVVAVPPNESHINDEYIDVTGRMHSQLSALNPPGKESMYSTAWLYSQVWKFEQPERNSMEIGAPDYESRPRPCTLAFREQFFTYGGKRVGESNDDSLDLLVSGRTHFGQYVYEGCAAARANGEMFPDLPVAPIRSM